MTSALGAEQLRCSICQDLFKDPVSTPCGHNFCQACLKHFWDTNQESDCPLCREVFQSRPELRINTGLRDITELFARSLTDKPKPVPAKRTFSRRSSKSADVPCDLCQGIKLRGVKSCLTCCKVYCENHLAPHLQDPALKRHSLAEPGPFVDSHRCKHHSKTLERFCRTDRTPVCARCTEGEHKDHVIVPLEQESKSVRLQMRETKTQFERMIHARNRKSEEIQNSVDLSNTNKEKALARAAGIAGTLTDAVEKKRAWLVDEMERRSGAAERRGGELLEELRRETDELQRRHCELGQLELCRDPLHLIQCFLSLSAPLSTRDWSEVSAEHSPNYTGAVRRAVSQLLDLCHDLQNTLSEEEVSKLSFYAVDVTLDPRTASDWLVLSPDRKKVSLGCQKMTSTVPDDPRRFDPCVAVLGEQSFRSGRHYWVVQVGAKTDWDLGLATESINRKGAITVCPDSGYWAICRRKGGSVAACAGPSVSLHLQKIPQKVGVYLDYEDGSVSFYDPEAKSHMYTYSDCAFTEPLYPYFNPCLHDHGKNTGPLVICPVVNENTTAL